MNTILETGSNYITSDNVAFLSVIITVLIFIITRHAEMRYKKYDDKKMFFDVGASLLLYGSKKIYRQYLLFRNFTTNPLIKQCKYYKEDIVMFIMADILKIMRKEVGLSYFNSIKSNEALAFL